MVTLEMPMKVQPSDMVSILQFMENSYSHAFATVMPDFDEPKWVKLAGAKNDHGRRSKNESDSNSDGSGAGEVSVGSLGHPNMCRRPCVYVSTHRANCPKGSNCTYCHLRHPQRRTTFDKRQREFLRNLSDAEMLSVLLPFLKSKAMKMPQSAWKVVRLLEEKLQLAGGPQAPDTLPNLVSVLEHMNFSWLVTLAPCKDDEDLVLAMDELRMQYT